LAQSQVTNLTTDLAAKANLAGGNSFTGAQLLTASAIANVPLGVKGMSGQTANIFEVSTNTTLQLRVTSTGVTQAYNDVYLAGITAVGGAQLSSQLSVISGLSTRIGAVIRGAASQSANLQEWQASDGTIRSKVDANGFAVFGSNTVAANALVTANPFGATQVGIAVKGAASQSANLQEWQNSAGTMQAQVDANGFIRANALATWNQFGRLYEANSGGVLRMTKATAAFTNPGAGLAGLYFRDGTNAGTLKLVVRAGAAGAETTILDNIPT
jgi:hypothetical protein